MGYVIQYKIKKKKKQINDRLSKMSIDLLDNFMKIDK